MRRSAGVSSFVATLIIVMISLSLSYVVYQGVRGFSLGKGQDTFSNQTTLLQGSPDILQVVVNSSQATTPLAFEVDSASSKSGILYFDGSGYASTPSLCVAGGTTFFSLFAASTGTVQVSSNGVSWIDGHLTASLPAQPGWNEVMISGASSCSVSGPGVGEATYPSAAISAVPLLGSAPSNGFAFYLPAEGTGPSMLVVFDGGEDRIA